MRILLNATTLHKGGTVQKAVQVVREALKHEHRHEWYAAVSPMVAEGLDLDDPMNASRVEVLSPSPARILRGVKVRRRLAWLERDFKPDVIYTASGPAYKLFRTPHVMAYGVPWVIQKEDLPWQAYRGLHRKIRMWLWIRYNRWWTGRADHWVVQTRYAAEELAERLGKPPDRFHVVPNGASEVYRMAAEHGAMPHPELGPKAGGEVRVLLFTAWKPHKNLEIVPAIAAKLRRMDPDRRWRFIFTFDRDSAAWQAILRDALSRGVVESLVNLGRQPIQLGPSLYAACDIMLQTSLIEVFSANYPEAMAMNVPVVTADRPYARDICRDAALYYDGHNPAEAAEQMLRIVNEGALREWLVARGRERLEAFGTPGERFERTLQVLHKAAGRDS